MEYNTEKTILEINKTGITISYNINRVTEKISLNNSSEELERLWKICEIIAEDAENIKILIGKMLDEREDF